MKNSVRQKLVATVVVAGLCSLSAQAISITTADYGITTVVPGTPASPAAELGYVKTSVDIWNGISAPGDYSGNTFGLLSGALVPASLTAPTAQPSNDSNFNGSGNTAVISLGGGGYQYLLTRWGGGDILYYVEGLSGDVTVENDLVSPGQTDTGLSHFALFGDENSPNPSPSVPDGASTLALLGPVLLGFGYFGRKTARA